MLARVGLKGDGLAGRWAGYERYELHNRYSMLLFPTTYAPDKLGQIDRSWWRCRGKWPARGGTEVTVTRCPLQSLAQRLKPESLMVLGGTLRRASLAQGRLRAEVVPFPKARGEKKAARPSGLLIGGYGVTVKPCKTGACVD